MGRQTGVDVVITAIGGTIGDVKSNPFLWAIRQIGLEVGRENCLYIHVTLVPCVQSSGELKTKPAQHSVKELQSAGIAPNIIVCRCDEPLGEKERRKISLFCNVPPDCVIENSTVSVLYEAPVMLERGHLPDIVCRELKLSTPPLDITEWNAMLARIASRSRKVRIGLVGKYVKMHDAYLSVTESLRHAGFENSAVVDIKWVEAEECSEDTAAGLLADCDGVLVPGGFGMRGIEGKSVCPGARHSLPGDLPWHAGGCGGVCPPCVGLAGCQLRRV